ncbi:hypothetical protein [Xanthomonas sp. 10-10]|uniref:Uncharacterized protein n=1 Tax=Xanthomonas sp. 10-10 TaxID=3115848 RepID=A0AAU7P7E8_9XANT
MNAAYAKPDNTVADWPLKFVRHSFGAACYSTYGCKVRYNNFLFIDDPDDKLEVSSNACKVCYNMAASRKSATPIAWASWGRVRTCQLADFSNDRAVSCMGRIGSGGVVRGVL